MRLYKFSKTHLLIEDWFSCCIQAQDARRDGIVQPWLWSCWYRHPSRGREEIKTRTRFVEAWSGQREICGRGVEMEKRVGVFQIYFPDISCIRDNVQSSMSKKTEIVDQGGSWGSKPRFILSSMFARHWYFHLNFYCSHAKLTQNWK